VRLRKTVPRFLLSFAISGLLLFLVLRKFDFHTTLASIVHADPKNLWLATGLIALAYGLRGFRWRVWERELRPGDSFKLILIGFMGNNVLPARLGEILRAFCTARKTGKDYGTTAALASIAIERVLDGFVLSCAGIIGLLLVPVGKGYLYSLLFVSLAFAALTLSLIASIYFHQWVRDLLKRIHTIFPGHLTRFGQEKVNFFLDGLLLIKGFSRFTIALLGTISIWALEFYAYFLIADAVFPGFSWKVCIIFMVVVNFASLFPFSMGGIGAIEGVTTFFLISAGIPEHESLAMVTLQHSIQFCFTTILGAAFYFLGGYYLPASAPAGSRKPGRKKAAAPPDLDEAYRQIDALAVKLNLEKNTATPPDLSIVIPGYNETMRLPKTLMTTITWCIQNSVRYEILYVDDGSRDGTLSIVKLFSGMVANVRFISCPHFGKGSAVRMGMLNATGKHVLFMDADGATPLDEIPKLTLRLQDGADVAIGSRVPQNPDETEVVTSLHRRIMGRTFSAIVNIFAIPGFADTQCGFKMFRSEAVKDIFSKQKLNGFAFDVEILFIAGKLGYRVAEVPVNWVNQDGSKVNIVSDSLKMLADILRIKWLHRRETWVAAERPEPRAAAREKVSTSSAGPTPAERGENWE
jgi:dolichyl-phosphate beta-glucosyltransferase